MRRRKTRCRVGRSGLQRVERLCLCCIHKGYSPPFFLCVINYLSTYLGPRAFRANIASVVAVIEVALLEVSV